jgi:hypothetical protein
MFHGAPACPEQQTADDMPPDGSVGGNQKKNDTTPI